VGALRGDRLGPSSRDGEQRKYHNFWTYSVHGLENTAPDGFQDSRSRQVHGPAKCHASPKGPFRYKQYADAFMETAMRYAHVAGEAGDHLASALSLMYPAEGIPGYSREAFIDDLLERARKRRSAAASQGPRTRFQIDFTEGRFAVKIDPTGQAAQQLHRAQQPSRLIAFHRRGAAKAHRASIRVPGGRPRLHAQAPTVGLRGALCQLCSNSRSQLLSRAPQARKDRERVFKIVKNHLKAVPSASSSASLHRSIRASKRRSTSAIRSSSRRRGTSRPTSSARTDDCGFLALLRRHVDHPRCPRSPRSGARVLGTELAANSSGI